METDDTTRTPELQSAYDVEEAHEESDEQARTVLVITKARMSHISLVDPRRQHQDDPRQHKPE